MMSAQIQRLVDCLDSAIASNECDVESDKLRKDIYTKILCDCPDGSRALRVANAYSLFLAQKKVVVDEFELFAGNMRHFDLRPSVPVTPVRYPSGTQAGDARVSIDTCKEYFSSGTESLYDFVDAMESGIFTHTANGHITSGFNYFVDIGYPEYRRRIIEELKKPDRPVDEIDELNAMLIVVDAAILYHGRYARAAFDAAEMTADDVCKSNLLRIGHACEKLTEGPPETFFEAIQSILLLQELLIMESAAISLSFGRLDRILYPYYKKSGISFDEAQDLIYAFNIKISSLVESYQNVMICGCDSEGNFAGNDISVMFLRGARNLHFDQPQLCMRYTKDMPMEYWNEALETIAVGHGFPAIFNDDIVIASKTKAGVAAEDVWDYAASGCVEMSYGGREWCNTELLRINWLKVLELILNNGYCQYKNRNYPMAENSALEEIKSYGQLLQRFKNELTHFIDIGTDACNQIETVYYKCYPTPMLSVITDGCIEKGLEASNRGAKYSFSTINNTGMANVVGALLAIKKIVFDEKLLSLTELRDILNDDFSGNESIRAFCLNRCEKYGNDLDEPDLLMQELMDFATTYESSIKNLRGGHYMPGAYSVAFHAHMGACTAASADGRRKSFPLANSMCPVQGTDMTSPTAVINSATKCDHSLLPNGMVLDFKFNSTFFNNDAHRDMFHSIVKTYFDQGGMEIQFNVIDPETLLDAQKFPERYPNLLVRVSGFSAYFATLHKGLQDEIIARTQYA